MLQDDLPHERQIEVIPQSGDFEDRQKDAQKKTDTKQSLIVPDKGDKDIQYLAQFHSFELCAVQRPRSIHVSRSFQTEMDIRVSRQRGAAIFASSVETTNMSGRTGVRILTTPRLSEAFHPRSQLDLACPSAAWLTENIEVGERDRIGIKQRVGLVRVVAASGATDPAVDDEVRDVDPPRAAVFVGRFVPLEVAAG